MRTKLVNLKYKIDADDLLDLIDMARVADNANILTVCSGGRYIHEGYVCVICGSDDPSETCGEPRENILEQDLSFELSWMMPIC